MPRVIHFELPADDPERACRFYTEVFGWQFQKWDGPSEYWLITTGNEAQPGINGGLMRACKESPARAAVNTLDVPSVDDYVCKVEAAGGKVVMPKMAIPGVGHLAYCQDTEGVMFGIMQFDPAATP